MSLHTGAIVRGLQAVATPVRVSVVSVGCQLQQNLGVLSGFSGSYDELHFTARVLHAFPYRLN
ncbi:MAG: hypothetical protein DWI22_13440 [Planctomycetota bacterium]|nr:MAG: hypothetical protein DWI22_13440 [Planctomycetota bacterium]